MNERMNEHAQAIERVDQALQQNWERRNDVWAKFGRTGEYGEPELTASGKRQIKALAEERRNLEETAAALYRMRP